jgi:isopentenyl-diphosphate delta-isomerase
LSAVAAAHMTQELVVLVEEQNRTLGTMAKADVHQTRTPQHRGFSCFVFRLGSGQLLLQQRSGKKQTWPLVWSNSCCGHPGPCESSVDATRRRLRYELGLDPILLEEVSPYRYCFSRDGVMESIWAAVPNALGGRGQTLRRGNRNRPPDEPAVARD